MSSPSWYIYTKKKIGTTTSGVLQKVTPKYGKKVQSNKLSKGMFDKIKLFK